MISRKHRFHGHNSLNHVYRTGSTVRGEFIALKHTPSRGEDYRLAVVVSKKVSKSAVVRNRIRRRIYEIIRRERKTNDKPLPYDMVVTVFDERLAKIPGEKLRHSVVGLLEKAHILSR